MDELALTLQPGPPEATTRDELTYKDFNGLGKKALCAHMLGGIAAGVYAYHIRNALALEAFSAIFHIWFVILGWCIALPGKQTFFLLSLAVVILTYVIPLLVAHFIYHGAKAGNDDAMSVAGSRFSSSLFIFFVNATNLAALFGLYCLRVSLRSLYSGKDLNMVALQCLTSALKMGVIQVSIFTFAIVAIGAKPWQEIYAGISQYPNDDKALDGYLTSFQAELAGFAINAFLVQTIMTQHLLRQRLIDLARNRLGLLEYLLVTCQIAIVVAVSVFLSLSHEDVADYLFDHSQVGKIQVFLMLTYCLPMLALFLSWIFYSRTQVSGNRKWEFFQERHQRISLVEHQLMQAQKERQHLLDLAVEALQRSSRVEESFQELQKLNEPEVVLTGGLGDKHDSTSSCLEDSYQGELQKLHEPEILLIGGLADNDDSTGIFSV